MSTQICAIFIILFNIIYKKKKTVLFIAILLPTSRL